MLGFSPWPGLAGPAGTSGTCRGQQASVRPSVGGGGCRLLGWAAHIALLEAVSSQSLHHLRLPVEWCFPTMAASHSYAHLLPPAWKGVIAKWLEEDCPSFDWGGYVVGEAVRTATLYQKAPGVVAGVPFFDEVFRQVDCTVEWFTQDGAYNTPEGKLAVAKVTGPVRNLLLGERVALNTLARCSGIATAYVTCCRESLVCTADRCHPVRPSCWTPLAQADSRALLPGRARPHLGSV